MSVLWDQREEAAWDRALRHYWDLIPDRARELEERLERGVRERIRSFNKQEWFGFLYCEYFPWKYTAPNRLVTTRRQLLRHIEKDELQELEKVRVALLTLDHTDIVASLTTAARVRGLGTAGASGLLALMYPEHYGTVDQFMVKALAAVPDLAEHDAVAAMNPEGLTPTEGAILVRILKSKAKTNNERFGTLRWTPRMIDKVLWAVGRGDS